MKLTIQQLMEMYPLEVYFPQGGQHYVLIVHTESEQQEFLVGRTEENLRVLFEAKLKNHKYGGFTIRGLWRCEMVGPPMWMRELYARQRHRQSIESFKTSLFHVAADYEKGFELPDGIAKCPKYEPTDWKPDPSDFEWHTDCKNCKGLGYVLTVDLEDLYDFKHYVVDAWHVGDRAPLGTKPKARPHPVPFVGEEADPSRTLFVGMPKHGHHSGGNVIEQVTWDKDEEYLPFLNGYSMPLFFFHGEMVTKEPKWAADILEKEKQYWREQEKLNKTAYHNANKKRQESSFQMLDTVFDVKERKLK
jgi:hypothetical protein